MSSEWACIRFRRDLWDTTVKPALTKVAAIIEVDVESKSGRVECVEQICRMLNDTPLERLKRELD